MRWRCQYHPCSCQDAGHERGICVTTNSNHLLSNTRRQKHSPISCRQAKSLNRICRKSWREEGTYLHTNHSLLEDGRRRLPPHGHFQRCGYQGEDWQRCFLRHAELYATVACADRKSRYGKRSEVGRTMLRHHRCPTFRLSRFPPRPMPPFHHGGECEETVGSDVHVQGKHDALPPHRGPRLAHRNQEIS